MTDRQNGNIAIKNANTYVSIFGNMMTASKFQQESMVSDDDELVEKLEIVRK